MSDDVSIWVSRLEREKRARKEAERLLEEKSLELWRTNCSLQSLADELRVSHSTLMDRSAKLELINNDLIEKEHKLAVAVEQATSASRAKSEFLALVSHELRTPMAGVIGMLSLALRQDMASGLRHQIDLARSNAEALLNIVNDLLDLSKIEAGKMQLEQIDFRLVSLLDDSMVLLREGALQKSISASLTVDPQLPPFLKGDPTRLRQILVNLAGNALKFTEEGSIQVIVRGRPAPLENSPEAPPNQQPWIRFEVVDTGIGISKEARSRMFQKFEQADTSTTRKFGGTGLGLSICRQLVQLMGGVIGVTSRQGEGSTFFFEIPMSIGDAPIEDAPYELSPHAESLDVLVVEDSYTNQVIISSLLEEMGHRHVLVENGQLALQALQSGVHFDLILMDGRMPIMDGLEATRHIRAGLWAGKPFANPQIPVYGLTANAGEQDRAKFMSAGVDGFLSKPIDEVALHKTLGDVINRRRQKSPD